MKTLQDVAKQFKKSAGKAIYPGVKSSLAKFKGKRSIPNFTESTAFRTGNLLSKFVTANNPANIGRKTVTGYELVLEVGPTGATYGTYVHYGTSKMGARPFAEIATEDADFQNVLDEFLGDKANEMVLEEMGAMDALFRTAGFDIS